jgi:hypothetical protein
MSVVTILTIFSNFTLSGIDLSNYAQSALKQFVEMLLLNDGNSAVTSITPNKIEQIKYLTACLKKVG